MNPGPTVRPLQPKPGKVYPNASIKALRWSLPDHLAATITAGAVLRLEVIVSVDELREHNDGPRWNMQVLAIENISE